MSAAFWPWKRTSLRSLGLRDRGPILPGSHATGAKLRCLGRFLQKAIYAGARFHDRVDGAHYEAADSFIGKAGDLKLRSAPREWVKTGRPSYGLGAIVGGTPKPSKSRPSEADRLNEGMMFGPPMGGVQPRRYQNGRSRRQLSVVRIGPSHLRSRRSLGPAGGPG